MIPFTYHENSLFCEDVPLSQIAERFSTPCYVYSKSYLISRCLAYADAFSRQKNLLCYSIKASSNIALLKIIGEHGFGCDIVSGGELYRAKLASIPANKIVYSGVGKTPSEIRSALEYGILFFNVESEQELLLINAVAAEMNLIASVSLRVNPDVDPLTHPYISTGLKENKFGIPIVLAERIYLTPAQELKHVRFVGVDCHIGSQLTQLSPFRDAALRVKELVINLRSHGLAIDYVDVGGGLGIVYDNEEPPTVSSFADTLISVLGDLDVTLVLEPGRSLVGNSSALLTRVHYLKDGPEKKFAIVDAAMNDLLRPSLYDAYQQILKVSSESPISTDKYDIVGPVCESGDFLARDRDLPELHQGDLLAVMSAGAYGFSMSSNYNSRLRPAEILVDGSSFSEIRRRDTVEDLVRGESLA